MDEVRVPSSTCFRTAFSGPGARFSKVPKLYGAFSGVTIPFVSQERRGLHSYFSFCCLENMLKDWLSKTSGWQFHKWLFGPEKFSGLSRNRPLAPVSQKSRELFGPISGATIPFISSQRRGSKPSNFAILFVFLTSKTC